MYRDDTWARTDLGTMIPLYASHAPTEWSTLRPLLLIGGVHGDEPLGVTLAEKTLAYLRDDAEKAQPEVHAPWILIPCLNVDGVRAGTRVNGRGVDLNRNYPSRGWSPSSEKPRYHPGTHPASEAEILALTQLIDQIKPRLLIHYHSWKPMIVCAGPKDQPDALRLAHSSGYPLEAEIGYPTPGSLSEFGWFDRGIPVICIEESDDAAPDQVWAHFGPGLREILHDDSGR